MFETEVLADLILLDGFSTCIESVTLFSFAYAKKGKVIENDSWSLFRHLPVVQYIIQVNTCSSHYSKLKNCQAFIINCIIYERRFRDVTRLFLNRVLPDLCLTRPQGPCGFMRTNNVILAVSSLGPFHTPCKFLTCAWRRPDMQ